MCRLFGLTAGSQPVSATFWLLDAPDSLSVQSRHNPDGTGIGWFDQGGQPQIAKQPQAAYQDRSFAQEARELSSSVFVSHIRFASTGALTYQNTHPFEQQGRLFAHNGVVQGLPALEQQIGEGMSLVHGDTDSERFFALITVEIAQHGGDILAGVSAAVRWVAANLPLLSLNFVLTMPGELWALRYPDAHDLFVLERPAGGSRAGTSADGDPRDGALAGTSSQGMSVHSAPAAERPTVVLASEEMDGETGWRPLASGELIHVDSDLILHSHAVIEEPPAHPLTLSELEGRARASQQG